MEMVATGTFLSPMNNDSKFIFGRDSVSFTYREAVDALSDQFVGWGETPLRIPRRLDSALHTPDLNS